MATGHQSNHHFNVASLHTWNGGAKLLGIHQQKLVLQSPPPNALGTNQNQSLPLKGRDLGHLLVD